MNDFISRQAAIDAFEALDWYHQNINKDMVSGANSAEHQAWYKADDVYKTIEEVLSAQPEIIRCKDCKHQPFDGEYTQGFRVEFPDEKCPCQCDDSWYNWRPDNEWFCANAERRTDG